MKFSVVIGVYWLDDHGQKNAFLLQKEYDLPARPIVGDSLEICGCSPFNVVRVDYDLDAGKIEVWVKRDIGIDSAQHFIDCGFVLLDTGDCIPDHLVWKSSVGG